MFIRLPSGRRLAYVKPKLGENRFGGTSITHEGIRTGRKWGLLKTCGRKLTENIVQAIARDILIETTAASVDEICVLMATVPDWAEGLPLEPMGSSALTT